MPIRSYVIYPDPERFDALEAELGNHPACSVHPSDRRELMVLVTETETRAADKELYGWLNKHPAIQNLTLSFADVEENNA